MRGENKEEVLLSSIVGTPTISTIDFPQKAKSTIVIGLYVVEYIGTHSMGTSIAILFRNENFTLTLRSNRRNFSWSTKISS